ncbi:periplasmic heavy metal sensor [Sedimentimonas flavescens]|uniref:Periplasmic heavy metal sensor n=1 Tax=Sedimentimonas flavescens TaxID=2851012 RepID=A0ABT2ZWT6_9RHOB|nr:periplasmic heavy metal sensor [Sedimentimonas flavescens]MCV2878072.1 periplasmic heavy metal sensor [Sedimentimonas flavescens]
MTQENTTAKPASGTPTWVRVLLGVSLTLNLLVAGVVVGGILGHDRHPSRPEIEEVNLGPFTGAFSRDDREAMRRAADAEGLSFRAMRREAREDLDALIGALEAEPWDQGAVAAMIGRYRERTLGRIGIGERLMIERLEQMQPAERRAFAERLRQGFDHGRMPPRDR